MNVRKKKAVAYYKNLYDDARANTEQYLDKIGEKFDRFRAPLVNFEFFGTDGVLLCNQAKKGDLLFYDPPVDVGNYEKEFAALESGYEDPEKPEYTVMTDEVKTDNLNDLNKRGVTVYYRNNNPTDIAPSSYKEVFRYVYKYGAAYCVYTNKPKNKWVGTFKPLKEEVKNYPIIGPDDEITENSEIKIAKVKSAITNHYRLMWVKKAEMLDSGYAYLVFCDGKLIGVMQLLSALKFGTDLCVINSDPAAPTSKYTRLSKLMLYIICTQEVLDMINEESMWQHEGFTTRVFSNAPVSMKYRSLFKLTDRKEDDGFYEYCLIYQNRDKILPTIKDGLKAWLSKDGKLTKLTR